MNPCDDLSLFHLLTHVYSQALDEKRRQEEAAREVIRVRNEILAERERKEREKAMEEEKRRLWVQQSEERKRALVSSYC